MDNRISGCLQSGQIQEEVLVMRRRAFALGLAAAAAALVGGPQVAHGQSYPNRVIRMVVPFAPGGSNDIIGRIIAERLTEALGQSVVIENKPGAGGSLGTDQVAKSAPDGYTLMIGATSTLAANPSLYTKMNLDPPKDLTPITQIATGPFVLAVPSSLPVKSVGELIALAKAKPGEINFGSSGVGSSLQLTAELFKSMAGINIVHVPYRGLGPALTDVVAGRIQIIFSDMAGLLPFVQSGQIRALGVTSAKRSADLPDLPTLAEAGVPGYDATSWYGILGPAGLPPEIVARLNAELKKIVHSPAMTERFKTLGIEAVTGTPQEFSTYIRSEMDKWRAVVKAADIKVD
jgi:tripartite-type tricarboxylate transporter receptor subunit TctC